VNNIVWLWKRDKAAYQMPNGAVKMELAHLLFIIGQLDFASEDASLRSLTVQLPSPKQDVVLLDVIPDEPKAHPMCIDAPSQESSLILEMNGAKLTIPNGIDTALLSQVLSVMKGSLC